MYNTFPITVTVESRLPINNGQAIVCNAETGGKASNLIEVVCRKMNIPFKTHLFLRTEKGQLIYGSDHLGQALGTKGNLHHYSLILDTHYVSKVRWFGASAGLILGMSAIIIAGSLFARTTTNIKKWEYGIIADAGSSHTSFLLYNWPENHMEDVKQIGECTTDGSEGIDMFVSNPEGIKGHLESCLVAMANDLGALGVTDLTMARIYLGATAGMRLANTSNHENSSQVMMNIDEVFEHSPFFYNPGDAKILTGQEEGAFSWITTNILAGTFNSSSDSTFGSLDMGGASMQIAFECLPGQCENGLTFDLYNQTFEVFSKSELCYGLNEAMKRFTVSLIYDAYIQNGRNIQNMSRNLPNGCFTRTNLFKDDWLVNFTSVVEDIFDSPCTTELGDAEFASAINELPRNHTFFHQKFGKNSSDCHEAVSIFFDPARCTALFGNNNCFDFEPENVHMPDLPAYYAMSSYYWEFFRYLNTTSSNVTYDFAKNRIDELCSPNFTSHGNPLYSETDCFQSSYIFDIITKGYKKFDESNFNTIFFALDINGAEVSWGLGFLVNEIMQASVWGKLKKSFISTEIFVCLIIFGIFLMTLSILALKQFCSRYSLLKKMMQRNKI